MDRVYIVYDMFGDAQYTGTNYDKAMSIVQKERQLGDTVLDTYEDGKKAISETYDEVGSWSNSIY